jgi:hypothetical protein
MDFNLGNQAVRTTTYNGRVSTQCDFEVFESSVEHPTLVMELIPACWKLRPS